MPVVKEDVVDQVTRGSTKDAPGGRGAGGVGAKASASRRDVLFVGSLAKGIAVLRAFAGTSGPLTLQEIAEGVGENRSSVQRSVYTLVQVGFLEMVPGARRYRPTVRCLELADAFMRCDPLVERAWPYLSYCHQTCEETVNLSKLVNRDIILVSRLPSRHVVSTKMNLGARAPAFCTAPGRAILAHLSDEAVEAALAPEYLRAFTIHTRTDPADIRARITEVRTQGYAIQSEELALGDLSIAAPVLDATGRAIAAVNVAVPTSRWTPDELEARVAPLVIETARAITRLSVIGAEEAG